MIQFPFFTRRGKEKPAQATAAGGDEARDQHRLEIAQFKEVLESFGATRIDERLAILAVFLSTEKHVTLDELEGLLQENKAGQADRLFLQETMAMFCRFGFAREITFESHAPRYEHHHLGTHHDHFICTRCGHIQEFVNRDLEHLQMTVAREFQFHPLQHKMEIYGLCADCMGQREGTIPLHMACKGERVRIVRIDGGRDMRARLASMGLGLNTCIEVVSKGDAGPFIVAVAGTRMALGGTVTQHIFVMHSCYVEEAESSKL